VICVLKDGGFFFIFFFFFFFYRGGGGGFFFFFVGVRGWVAGGETGNERKRK